jgi:hypothetical protein
VNLSRRKAFYVFENGEIATINRVSTAGFINGAGPFMQYATINFADGSPIIMKSQGAIGGGAGGRKSGIIKGTGRCHGIEDTQAAKAKYLTVEKGEAGSKGYGEGTIPYTPPPE